MYASVLSVLTRLVCSDTFAHQTACSLPSEYRKQQENADREQEKTDSMWSEIKQRAEASPLLLQNPALKELLDPIQVSSGKHSRSTSVLETGAFDLIESKSFNELTKSNADSLRRKSMMPNNKKQED